MNEEKLREEINWINAKLVLVKISKSRSEKLLVITDLFEYLSRARAQLLKFPTFLSVVKAKLEEFYFKEDIRQARSWHNKIFDSEIKKFRKTSYFRNPYLALESVYEE